jgi:hypothetical protein
VAGERSVMKKPRFQPVPGSYILGYQAKREDGILVQVVRCYSGQWDLFMVKDGEVVAMSIEAYRSWGHGYAPKAVVMQVAKHLVP